MSKRPEVGPVLQAGDLGRLLAEVIRRTNNAVKVTDRGSYLRITAPGICRLSRQAVEQALLQPFSLPTDLEAVMPSFQGRFYVNEDEALWK